MRLFMRLLLGIFLIIALVIVGLLITLKWSMSSVRSSGTRALVDTPPPQPSVTQKDLISAQSPIGFQLLVSYTDRGFEPSVGTIKAGQAVRFTNNSHHQLRVVANSTNAADAYSSAGDSCGINTLDSCKTLDPGGYWEFTFAKKGTWGYTNKLNQSDVGILKAQ